MALKGTICTNDFSGGITHEQLNVELTASLIAHMMGHNLGMEHDSRNCSCPEERCTMSSEFGISAPRHWSSCSKDSLAFAFNHGMDHCLRNKPLMIFGGPVCGNGFVESGEECDCGVKEHCDNACCNPDNCTLTINATCATGECCDLSSCKWKNRGTPCRTADNECDLAEYCTGNSEYCPDDEHKINGDVCKVGEAFCYQGRCRSRTDQCKVLWGEGSFSEDFCYNLNKKASSRGNCRYDSMNSSYYPCDDEDILCGRLQCHSDGNSLLFGLESAAVISHSFLMKNTEMVKCRAAIIDLGLNDPDPGLVPDGAQCGAGKMCLNQKCVAV
uniref:ADAM9 protein n=1 Tax=Fopius arisanus TaxID=64838 RepID=A0A0C9R7S6_9HYME